MNRERMISSIRGTASLSMTFTRGQQLMRQGKVGALVASEAEDDKLYVSSQVRGSTNKRYSAFVELDTRNNRVTGYGCDCPAAYKYEGMCKHAVALALAYLRDGAPATAASESASGHAETGETSWPFAKTSSYESWSLPVMEELEPTWDEFPFGSELPHETTTTAGTAVRARPKPPVYTSRAIEDLIAGYTAANIAASGAVQTASYADPAAEPVELLCTLTPGDSAWRYSWTKDTWALGLKVVRGKVSYVVKSIAELVRVWHAGAVFKYGKNLEFRHTRSAFSDRANSLLEILSDQVDAQLSLYAAQEARGGSSYYGYSANRVPSKTLPVSTTQLCAILDLYQGASVIVEDEVYERYAGYRKHRVTYAVGKGEPRLAVSLTTEREGSYDLAVEPAETLCITDGKTMYLSSGKQLLRCPDDYTRDLGAFCDAVLPSKEPLHISDKDMPGFCAAVLPQLRAHTDLVTTDEVNEFVPVLPEFAFRIAEDEGFITCTATVSYGEDSLPLFEAAREGQPLRDVVREVAAQRLVETYFPNGVPPLPDYARPIPKNRLTKEWNDDWRRMGWLNGYTPNPALPQVPFFPKDDDLLYYLLFTDGLAQLAEVGEVELSERLRQVTVRSAPSVRVDASVRSGLLDISVRSDDMDPHELAAYLSSYVRKQRFVRLSSGDIVRLDGSVEAIADLANGLGVDVAALAEEPQELPQNRVLFVDAMLKRADGVRFERNRAFRKIVRDFETVADADYTAPAGLDEVMRSYQRDGFKWLCTLGATGFGGILADDMGLGKTLQLIAYLAHYREETGEEARKPSLVVCPASLVYNWRAEAERFYPDLEVACITGTKAARRTLIGAAEDFDLLVTSYDLLRRDVEELAEVSFHAVALDEAQYVKNAKTKAAQAVRTLDADVRFALTGTPIENRLLELWSIFDFLMPGVLGTDGSFTNRFANPIAAGEEGAAERLRRLVSPFILRRRKQDVLRDLPDKNESSVVATMEGEQAKLYRALESKLALSLAGQAPEEFAGSRIKVLAELTKLRQVCCDPALLYENYKGGSAKLDMCLELVRQAMEGGHRVLLFSQFTSMLELMEARLRKEGVSWLKLTGATSKEERVRLVERFQAGDVPVFLISLKAGGTGLNLTAADVVIHYDPWWNLAAQNQATDRTHRIGQTREVSVFKLIAKDTIEERIVALQEAKHDLAESVLGGEVAAGTAITQEDLLALLGATAEG